MKNVFMGFAILLLTSCSDNSDARYDSGYSDGYATGYNTTCEIRATLIAGDWDDEHYSRGYREGYASGSYDCKNK
jgi:hypothetical protein|tara:strand:+ start:669 stop:893 length:225 start_codon:yes stop_codon:yes gene_type:complete